jgi:hypothetical protein
MCDQKELQTSTLKRETGVGRRGRLKKIMFFNVINTEIVLEEKRWNWLEGIEYEAVDWDYVTQNTYQYWAFVKTVMKIRGL